MSGCLDLPDQRVYLALHYPDLVRSAVLIGQALNRDGETEVSSGTWPPGCAGHRRRG
jgi:hypothetical protein